MQIVLITNRVCCADDLDLHVRTPDGTEISFIYDKDFLTGGELDHDDCRSSCNFGRHSENINFPLDGSAPDGTYKYWVENYAQRNAPDQWSVAVYENNVYITGHVGILNDGASSPMFNYTK